MGLRIAIMAVSLHKLAKSAPLNPGISPPNASILVPGSSLIGAKWSFSMDSRLSMSGIVSSIVRLGRNSALSRMSLRLVPARTTT